MALWRVVRMIKINFSFSLIDCTLDVLKELGSLASLHKGNPVIDLHLRCGDV